MLPVDAVAENPQLKARAWWSHYRVGERVIEGPGAPYVLSETPWSMGELAEAGADTEAVLAEIGWE